MNSRYPQRVPSVLTVCYQSGREEKHHFASYRDARKAQEKFEKLTSVTSTQIRSKKG